MRKSIEKNIRTAWAEHAGAVRNIEYGYQQWEAAEKILEARERDYGRHAITIDKLIEAHGFVQSARETIEAQKYAAVSSQITLFQAMGLFDVKSLGIPVQVYDAEKYRRNIESYGWLPIVE
jgi:outer membrane protein TolC